MDRLKQRILSFALTAAAAASPLAHSTGAETRLDPESVLARSEAAIGRKVGSYALFDADGEMLALKSYRGRPLVVSLVYTSCASVCPVTTQHLLEAVGKARRVVGEDGFAVLTVGFDARRDTPERLKAFARDQGVDLPDWRVASADSATITALLSDLGFSYDAAAGGFEHITQTSILDADGRVYRHVYGPDFPEQVFIEPLKELVLGVSLRSLSISDLTNKIRFICTVYNPSSGAYEFDYAIAFGIVIGGFSLLLTGFIIFRLWRNNRRLEAARAAENRG